MALFLDDNDFCFMLSFLPLGDLLTIRAVNRACRDHFILVNPYLSSARLALLTFYLKIVKTNTFVKTRNWVKQNIVPFDRQEYLQKICVQSGVSFESLPEVFRIWILEWPTLAAIPGAWPGLPFRLNNLQINRHGHPGRAFQGSSRSTHIRYEQTANHPSWNWSTRLDVGFNWLAVKKGGPHIGTIGFADSERFLPALCLWQDTGLESFGSSDLEQVSEFWLVLEAGNERVYKGFHGPGYNSYILHNEYSTEDQVYQTKVVQEQMKTWTITYHQSLGNNMEKELKRRWVKLRLGGVGRAICMIFLEYLETAWKDVENCVTGAPAPSPPKIFWYNYPRYRFTEKEVPQIPAMQPAPLWDKEVNSSMDWQLKFWKDWDEADPGYDPDEIISDSDHCGCPICNDMDDDLESDGEAGPVSVGEEAYFEAKSRGHQRRNTSARKNKSGTASLERERRTCRRYKTTNKAK